MIPTCLSTWRLCQAFNDSLGIIQELSVSIGLNGGILAVVGSPLEYCGYFSLLSSPMAVIYHSVFTKWSLPPFKWYFAQGKVKLTNWMLVGVKTWKDAMGTDQLTPETESPLSEAILGSLSHLLNQKCWLISSGTLISTGFSQVTLLQCDV